MLLTYLLINGFFGFVGCRRLYTRAAVPSDVWGRELSGRAADSARGLRLKLLKWKVHCSNPLVTGSNPVGGATIRADVIRPSRSRQYNLERGACLGGSGNPERPPMSVPRLQHF